MAHLDLLSRSPPQCLRYRLTSIVPLAPLDRPLSTCFRYCPAVLDVSWVKVHGHAVTVRRRAFASASHRVDHRRESRGEAAEARHHVAGTILLPRARAKETGSRGDTTTRPLSPYRLSEGRVGDVCIHRPAVFRSNKSSSRRFFLSRGSQCSPPGRTTAPFPPFVSSAHRRSSPLPGGDVFYSVCIPRSYDVRTERVSRGPPRCRPPRYLAPLSVCKVKVKGT